MRKTESLDLTVEHQEILAGLTSKHVGYRITTERRLQEMGPRGAEILLDILRRMGQQRGHAARLTWVMIAGIGVAMVTFVAISALSGNAMSLTGLFGIFGFLGLGAFMGPRPGYYQVINALSQLNDCRAVGALADALSIREINSRAAVVRALMQLMPQVTAEDAAALTITQRTALRGLLTGSVPDLEADLMVDLMKTLSKAEDVASLSLIGRIAARHPQTDNEQRVVDAANETSRLLQAAKLRQDDPQWLLRASANAAPPEQLLRATAGVRAEQPEQLLRAGTGPTEDE